VSTSDPRRVFVHIGAPKTGTTYLQAILRHNQQRLAAAGVLYPQDIGNAHFHAALDLRGAAFAGHRDPSVEGAWERVSSQVRRWTGPTGVISHELLAAAKPEHAKRVLESLAPAEVHLVYTARDIGRQIPAMWQESIKNGQTLDFRTYVKRLRRPLRKGRAARIFWRSQDPLDVLSRWSVIPAEHVHVVTVPPRDAGASLLWRRLCEVVGLDADQYDIDVPHINESLGLAEAELLRRINIRLDGQLPWPDYEAVVKHHFAEGKLAQRRDSPRAALSPKQHSWAVGISQRFAAGLESAGCHVVGDLAELVPAGVVSTDRRTRTPDSDAVIDVAADVLAQRLVERAAQRAGSPRERAKSVAVRLRLRSMVRRLFGRR
jgi:hypothetical protein